MHKLSDEGVCYCLAIAYEADALGTPDPSWKGSAARSIQDAAFEEARYALFTLWLVRPTSLHFREVAHIVNREDDQVVRQIEEYDPQCPLPGYADDPYTTAELELARTLFITLRNAGSKGTVRTAVHAVMRAQGEREWTMRFLVLWLAVESLFGPEDAREITFRLSQRIALFLERESRAARKTFSRVKESYKWRSKIVHGMRLERLTTAQSDELIIELEGFVRRSLSSLLSSDEVMSKFDGKERETYLDHLVFK